MTNRLLNEWADLVAVQKVLRMLPLEYPDQGAPPVAMPTPKDERIFRVTPKVISVPDYSKGFGHTDFLTC